MKGLEKADIEFVRNQTQYVNAIKNEILNKGQVTFVADDVDALDKLAQTLASYYLFLVAQSFSKSSMQYLVNEVHGKASASSGEAKVFNNLSEVIKFITNTNKNQKIFVDGNELDEEKLRETLKGKLSTISVSNEFDKHKKWLITAF